MKTKVLLPMFLSIVVLLSSGCTSQKPGLSDTGPEQATPVEEGPVKTELIFNGFTEIEIKDIDTDFTDNKLYIALMNPNPENIIIKKVTATCLDITIDNITNSDLISLGRSFTYEFDFEEKIQDDMFWIDIDILYDIPDLSIVNQKASGSVIHGITENQTIRCLDSSFEVKSYNFYTGSRIFMVKLINTGNNNLTINSFYRDDADDLIEAIEPFELAQGELKTIETTGLIRTMSSVIFVSEECPGTNQVIFSKDIPGL
jgi:hypothetical protein